MEQNKIEDENFISGNQLVKINELKINKLASFFDRNKLILIFLNFCLLAIDGLYDTIFFFLPAIPSKYLPSLFSYKTLIFFIIFYYLYFIFIHRNENRLTYFKVFLLFLLVGFLIHPFIFLSFGLLLYR